jgi:DDE superfamily endonuclease
VDQTIPSLAELLGHFRPCFRAESYSTFCSAVEAWFVCLGPRSLSEVWQSCVSNRARHYCSLYDFFCRAKWDWDELGKILLLLLILQLVPPGFVWLAVDDTLCHKRGKKVAFGGIFLDPVLSSKKIKVFRYAVNYVVLALVVQPPFRPDRAFALPVLWRAFRKKGQAGHKKKTELARDLALLAAAALPARRVWLVGDSAYVNASVLRDRLDNLEVIGPLPLKAALHRVPGSPEPNRRGRPPVKGERLPTPRQMLEMPQEFVADEQTFALPNGRKVLRVQALRGVLWYTGCKEERVAVVLLRDPSGSWRDEALLCTDVTLAVEEVVAGYCRRWAIEVAFHDAKQYLGLADARVWSEGSVARAHPMALFCVSLAVLWQAKYGEGLPEVRRERPWYKAPGLTFTALLGRLRLAIWSGRIISEGTGACQTQAHPLDNLLHCLAAVR